VRFAIATASLTRRTGSYRATGVVDVEANMHWENANDPSRNAGGFDCDRRAP
jgi:hypothetical protein